MRKPARIYRQMSNMTTLIYIKVPPFKLLISLLFSVNKQFGFDIVALIFGKTNMAASVSRLNIQCRSSLRSSEWLGSSGITLNSTKQDNVICWVCQWPLYWGQRAPRERRWKWYRPWRRNWTTWPQLTQICHARWTTS